MWLFQNLGRYNDYVFNLWGVFEGLCLAQAHGFSKGELHDSKTTVDTLSKGSMSNVAY